MSITELRLQMSQMIDDRNKIITRMNYHNTEAAKLKNEANILHVKIEMRNTKISKERLKNH